MVFFAEVVHRSLVPTIDVLYFGLFSCIFLGSLTVSFYFIFDLFNIFFSGISLKSVTTFKIAEFLF